MYLHCILQTVSNYANKCIYKIISLFDAWKTTATCLFVFYSLWFSSSYCKETMLTSTQEKSLCMCKILYGTWQRVLYHQISFLRYCRLNLEKNRNIIIYLRCHKVHSRGYLSITLGNTSLSTMKFNKSYSI